MKGPLHSHFGDGFLIRFSNGDNGTTLSGRRKPVRKEGLGLVGRKKLRILFGYAHLCLSDVAYWATNIVQPPFP